MSNITNVVTDKTTKPKLPTVKTPILEKPKYSREDELGALWVWESKNGGDEYMTGEISLKDGSKTPFIVFRNNFKDSDKKPDWRIYKRLNETQQTSVPRLSLKTPIASAEKLNKKVDAEVENENGENQDQEDLSVTL